MNGRRSGKLYAQITEMIRAIEMEEINSAGFLMPEGLLVFIPNRVLKREKVEGSIRAIYDDALADIPTPSGDAKEE